MGLIVPKHIFGRRLTLKVRSLMTILLVLLLMCCFAIIIRSSGGEPSCAPIQFQTLDNESATLSDGWRLCVKSLVRNGDSLEGVFCLECLDHGGIHPAPALHPWGA